MSKYLLRIGVIFILLGLLWPLFQKIGLGHLPGDIVIKRNNITFYFPITTCFIISILLSLVWWLLQK